ncbi:hypothetical protein [Xenorhabdus szentirmaii]|uniref:hypothetical protein n=1 Tax=Xenorhabdus szentirmaii TaxID=290112 RepID=UPI0019C35DAF|nr:MULTISPECIES: hypothetical protein [unclassified Xenorhabdus]MBD2803702.1 hypothetical protein [Xenorhabdus sp. ZM]MBD2826704.1 hypothetical protein [Xenorhabdus sp. 5]
MADPFMASIDAFVNKAKGNIEAASRGAFIKILSRLVIMSPVGNPELWKINQTAREYNQAVHDWNEHQRSDPSNLTPKKRQLKKRARSQDSMDIKAPPGYTGGRFRGNWQVTFDDIPTEETGRIDKSGTMTKAVGELVIGQFKVGVKAVYFSNVVPYAYRLEMGHSTQSPNGMIAVTAQEFQKFFSEAVTETKS